MKKLKQSNSRLKIEKREYKTELKVYKKYTYDLLLMLKSKSNKKELKDIKK